MSNAPFPTNLNNDEGWAALIKWLQARKLVVSIRKNGNIALYERVDQ